MLLFRSLRTTTSGTTSDRSVLDRIIFENLSPDPAVLQRLQGMAIMRPRELLNPSHLKSLLKVMMTRQDHHKHKHKNEKKNDNKNDENNEKK